VKNQLTKGITFSLSTELEQKLARKLIEYVPSAQMVRFGKNGTDATSGAIRLARAVTGKDHVLVCGYHGWQDWYIGSTTKSLGVPEVTQRLTHHFIYNNLDSLIKLLEKYKNNVAAVIMEPMNVEFPKNNFLLNCKKITHANKALFVFDETITGFRFSLGGAQKYFGVTPDLSTFGKGLGNGYPISALVGKKEYMEIMKDVFISSTFGGESLSIAASLAVIEQLENNESVDHIKHIGEQIIEDTKTLIKNNQLEGVISISGHPCWSFLIIKNCSNYSSWEIKTLFMQECLKRGLLTFSTHNISLSYGQNEVSYIKKVYSEVFPIIRNSINNNKLYEVLSCDPIKQLFRVRDV
jgi:glutamate-1-semialdehyde 2,1-aminomutase